MASTHTFTFLQSVIDSLAEHVAVIDTVGCIQFVNARWRRFGAENGIAGKHHWEGVSYLDACDVSGVAGDEGGTLAARGIREMVREGLPEFSLEYPCHSPTEKRWFLMRITPFAYESEHYLVVSHLNITERKLAEQRVESLARMDGLTGLANRRALDEFIGAEWGRAMRSQTPISVAMIDADHFKMLNDTYGHTTGDECLKSIAGVLRSVARRPGDFCARFGGEEFVLVLGNTSADGALAIGREILQGIRALAIPNINAPHSPTLTLSIGLATCVPARGSAASTIIELADASMYRAKSTGRDRLVVADTSGLCE